MKKNYTLRTYAVILAVLLIMDAGGQSLAKIITYPLVRYVHENENTRLECHHVRQDDTFIDFAEGALWHRLVNGVHHDIEPSDRVYASSHILFFDSFMSEFDQGQYECCVPQEGCSGPANITLVLDPIAEIVSTSYAEFRGHNVLLSCRIIFTGMPPAEFYWERHGAKVTDKVVITNGTHNVLKLTNLTNADGGEYMCVAEGVLSLERHSVFLLIKIPPRVMMHGPSTAHNGTEVLLTCSVLEGRPSPDVRIVTPSNMAVSQHEIMFVATPNDTGNYLCVANISSVTATASHFLYVYDDDNATSLIQFLADIHNGYCRPETERDLTLLLEKKILNICNCNVTIIPSGFKCINYSVAWYNVTVMGSFSKNVTEVFENTHLAPKLFLQIATLYICNHSCEGVTDNSGTTNLNDNDKNVKENGSGDDDDDDYDDDADDDDIKNSQFNAIVLILAISFACFMIVVLCFMFGVLTFSYITPQEKILPTEPDLQTSPSYISENKSNLSVPTKFTVTDTLKHSSKETTSSPAVTFKTSCEAQEAKHDSNISRHIYLASSDTSRGMTTFSEVIALEQQSEPVQFTSMLEGSRGNKNYHSPENVEVHSLCVHDSGYSEAEIHNFCTENGKQHYETSI